MSQKRILALSSSREGNSGFLETALPLIKDFIGDKAMRIAFIPFASVQNDYEEYGSMVRNALSALPYSINLVTDKNAIEIIEQSDAIMVGGGNTFKLLHDIYQTKTLEIIQDKVNAGAPYIGWSAGSNITAPTLSTTNDMPIIQPKSFKALGLFPFQINPHYFNQKPEGFNGETRDQRLTEFMKMNPTVAVIGLPEGTALYLKDSRLTFKGKNSGILFHAEQNNTSKKEILPEADLSYLL